MLDEVRAQPVGALSPRRILIYRPDHLGDLVLFSGALKHIRRRWPSAHITLAVYGHGQQLFAHCPHVDSLFPCEELDPPLEWMRPIPGLHWALRKVRKLWSNRANSAYVKFRESLTCDLAVMPLLGPTREHHAVMDLISAQVRLGIRGNLMNQSPWTEILSRSTYSAQWDASGQAPDAPELETTRRFLRFMDIEAEPAELWPEFWNTPQDRTAAISLVPDSQDDLILGIAPAVASVPGKNLPPEWYSAVLDCMKGHSFQVVLFGSAADAAICNQVEMALGKNENVTAVLNLAGKTNVRQLIECMKRCDLVLTQETANLHIATALQKRVAGIVGGGHFGRFFPWGDSSVARVVNKPMECYGCNWRCKYQTMRCIQEIAPADAAKELLYLLECISSAGVPGQSSRQTQPCDSNQPRTIHGH